MIVNEDDVEMIDQTFEEFELGICSELISDRDQT
jgi:hypothetical protein